MCICTVPHKGNTWLTIGWQIPFLILNLYIIITSYSQSMASCSIRLEILHKSVSNLHNWLDKCQERLSSIPKDFESADLTRLKSLATEYKVNDTHTHTQVHIRAHFKCVCIQNTNYTSTITF